MEKNKRYVVGDIYYSSENFLIRHIHDSLMDIDCFMLEKEEAEPDELIYVAKVMQEDINDSEVVILSVKQIDGKNAVIFSKENKSMTEKKTPYEMVGEIAGSDNEVSNALKAETLLNGRYKILCCIGVGGFGITYLCEDIYLKRNIAIKEYFPEKWVERDETYVSVRQSSMLKAYKYGMESFIKEIKISSRFIHTDNLITVYDAFMENDTVYMVMEYLPGMSIGREMKKRSYKPYKINEMAEIILPVLHGLIKVHELGLIHSDISPGNIIRTYTGYICLIDFGAAKYIGENISGMGSVFLKESYAAPEQYRTAVKKTVSDEGPYTDIYAIGATMYYLLTGVKPPDSLKRLSDGKTELNIPFKYKISCKKWMNLIGRCMEPDTNKRLSSAEQLYSEIKKMRKL